MSPDNTDSATQPNLPQTAMKKRIVGFKPYFLRLSLIILIVLIAALARANSYLDAFYAKKSETSPTPFIASNPTPDVSSIPSASYRPVVTPSPTTASIEPSVNPSPAASANPSPTPAPSPDSTAPVIVSMTGPTDGSTVDFNNFCFPMYITDNVSAYPNLFVQTKFDTDIWSDWSNNVAPCYNNVANGTHSFSVQAKDEAGNISASITRNFTVAVP